MSSNQFVKRNRSRCVVSAYTSLTFKFSVAKNTSNSGYLAEILFEVVIILTKLSFKCNLIRFLPRAIILYQERLGLPCGYETKLGLTERLETIPVHQITDSGKVVYQSAIALKLASVWQLPPASIATDLISYFTEIVNTEASKDTDKDTENFQVEVMSSGMIYFRLTDLGIANWLDYLTSAHLKRKKEELLVGVESDKSTATRLFPIQYSHARCCSLLRMGESDRLITLTPTAPETCYQFWLIETPNPIPWQQPNGQLQLLHPAESKLISQLSFTLDSIYCVSGTRKPVNWEKVADALSAAFQTFYSQCRIWGEVKTETPKLAQARLGLVLATQCVLRFLLEARLGGEAPIEL